MDHKSGTAWIVGQQLAAMGAAGYEVGVKRADGQMRPFVLTAAGVRGRVAWLERENAGGADVFVRPAGSVGLVLVDDLGTEALKRMSDDGLAPAVTVETSPGNHQAWVRVAVEPIVPALATAVAKELATRYGGDPNSAAWRHYGRLAGFTNRKPKHRRPDGSYPVVRLVETTTGVAAGGGNVLDAARARLAAPPPAARTRGVLPVLSLPRMSDGPLSPLGALYRREVERLSGWYPASDLSRLDWMIVLSLARAFQDATAEELARAMVEGSPGLVERKRGHVTDYVTRTVGKALAVRGQESASL